MGRHKTNPNLPSRLTPLERYQHLKALGLCVSCGVKEATNGIHCYTCHARNLANNHRQFAKRKIERKTIQQKQDYFDFCVEQANKLKISYGEYMVLKSKGRV